MRQGHDKRKGFLMKMEIREPIQPIDVLGSLEVTSLNLEDRKREVYLDGKRVPKALETIILTGLDAMTQEYAQALLAQMETEGFDLDTTGR